MKFSLYGFLVIAFIPFLFSCAKIRGHYGTKSYEPVARMLNPADIVVPDGYKIEVVSTGLTYPTSVTFDDDGKIYVIEAGYAYGESFTVPRLLRVDDISKTVEIAKGSNNGPWTCVTFHEGNFYISEGGALEGGKILKIEADGSVKTILENLPSYGDHHTNGVIIRNGYIYFGQGTATNSAVVGKDNMNFGWLSRKQDFHDIPCNDVILIGENYETENLLSADGEIVLTGAFVPYGTKTSPGQVIKGAIPCNGAVMRVPLSGGSPELVAWGFRNPYGLAFDQQGELYVSDNGYDTRGSRPVFGTGDLLWKVETGAWYGWPDYSGKDSISGENFRARKIKPKPVLKSNGKTPPAPAAIFGVHSSANGFDFSRNPEFGYTGQAFVAQFGDMAPDVGAVYGSVGFKVVNVDVTTGNISNFIVNKGKVNGPASQLDHGGLERPVEARFSPDGKALYITDFGVMEITHDGAAPKKKTGVIWKITKQ